MRNRDYFFSKDAWKYFTRFYRGNYRTLSATSLGSAAQSFLILPIILLVKYTFDEVIPQQETNTLIYIGLIILGLRIINAAITLKIRDINIKIINTAIYRLREDLLFRLYTFPRSFYTREDLKIMHARIIQDSERLVNMSTALISRILPSILISIALCILLVFLNWYLLLIIILLIPVIFLTNRYMAGLIKGKVFIFQRAFEKFSKGMLFVLGYMDLTTIQSAQEQEKERQRKVFKELELKTGKMAFIYAINAQIQEVFTGIIGIVIIIIGGIAVATNLMTLGEFLSFYLAVVFLNKFLNLITTSIPEVVSGNESMITLFELADSKDEISYKGRKRIDFTGNIRMESITFSYDQKIILSDINLKITASEKIAIIGPNGTGKTTILNLILGLYSPQSGVLYADDVPYESLDMIVYRQSMGVVTQNPPLFSGTIKENLTYGYTKADNNEIIQASKIAHADDFISKLPLGYDTQIGEDAVLFSGGERQRIAIARALIRKPKILILDEPTNHIDNKVVNEIMGDIGQLDYSPTIIIISHDMGVVKHTDKIYFLEDTVLNPYKFESNYSSK